MMPERIAINIRIRVIRIVFFFEGLVLKRTASATPEFTSKPDIIAPAERLPFKYKSVIIMLEAQFGMSPTTEAMILLIMGLFKNMVSKYASPTYPIIKVITKLKRSTNTAIFIVCFKAEPKMLP